MVWCLMLQKFCKVWRPKRAKILHALTSSAAEILHSMTSTAAEILQAMTSWVKDILCFARFNAAEILSRCFSILKKDKL